jgi:signal transduction histidine kinase
MPEMSTGQPPDLPHFAENEVGEIQLKNNIAQVFLTASGNIIFQRVLSILLEYFQSKYGIFGYIDRQGNYVCPSITKDIWDECKLVEKDVHKEAIVFHPEVWSGLWGRGLQEGRTFVSSGPFHFPHGHVHLREVMIMPILYKGTIIGQIVLADKENGYNLTDQRVLESICNYVAPILHFRLEREWAKEDLESAKTRAEEANKVKSQFLANMSHELRTPLNGILGCLQLLENEKSDPEYKELIHIALQSGHTLLQLINDILEFSGRYNQADHLKLYEFSLDQELQALHSVFVSQLQKQGISLQYEIEPGLPAQVLGDVARLRQILVKLVGNAIKFSTHGSVNISVHNRLTPGGKQESEHPYLRIDPNKVYLLFVIRDQGIGLQDHQLNQVFDIFTQGDMSLSRNYSGAGLGLSVVKKNIDLMQGSVSVDNSGPGTAIYLGLDFELPGKHPPLQGERK